MPKKSINASIGENTSADKQVFFILLGYNKDDIDDTGFLLVRKDRHGEFGGYDVVDDIDNATWLKDDGNQERWLKFFNEEEELQQWKFHLVKRTKSKAQ